MNLWTTMIFIVLILILVIGFRHVNYLQQRLKNKDFGLHWIVSDDIEVGDEIIFGTSRKGKGIVLRCPVEGQTYTILTKQGSVKFIKEQGIGRTGYRAVQFVEFLEKWKGAE